LIERVGVDQFETDFRVSFPAVTVSRPELSRYIDEISVETGRLPQADWQCAVDAELARVAVDIAVKRHVGRRERIISREGEAWLQYGKDLSDTRTLIGTGGVFVHNRYAEHILRSGVIEHSRAQILRPKNPRMFVDASYLLYGVGLLSQTHLDVAARIFNTYMRPIDLREPSR
jgi:uncharacterized protein (TIGR01319 family)